MAHPYSGSPHQQAANLPPLQTHRQYSPSPYQQSPGAMSPGGIPPAKRQRLSPNPPSPYASNSPYPPQSPYSATSPPGGQYLSLPGTPASAQPPQSFHQPQPYQPTNGMHPPPNPSKMMPPPQVPLSRMQDNAELEKADPRGADINQISDVLSGAGIDLKAEEDNLLHSRRNQTGASFGASFNSQTSATVSPNNSFNQWSQPGTHGAFQGSGPLSQAVTEQQLQEDVDKQYEAARAHATTNQYHLTDPFLNSNKVRGKLANRTYEHGISMNLEGVYDKIPDRANNVNRTQMTGSNGESVAALQADSLLNRNASVVDFISLISLATQERLRTFLEDAHALSRGRQVASHGIVPPDMSDIATGNGAPQATTLTPSNISKTAWEAPESAISPMTVPGIKREPDLNAAARLPTPPTDAPPTPQPTVAYPNQIANTLKRLASRDRKFEEERLAKRQKRSQKASSASAESPAAVPALPIPEKMTKKERDRINKMGQSEDVLHRKANETASMALGGKKKYSWMTGGGGGGGGSGASTPSRINTSVGGASTPNNTIAAGGIDKNLQARDRQFGSFKETGPKGKNIQIRDLVHVLELDGREKKTLVAALARLKSTEI